MTRILIGGIGNIFLGDDGFGSEVAQALALRPLPDGVRVIDFGIRGFDLTYALMDGYDAAILVDVTKRGGAPGTLYVIEPHRAEPADDGQVAIDTHGMHPEKVLRLLARVGGEVKHVRVVGCEPLTFGGEDEVAMGLSEPVRAAIDPAVSLVESLVESLVAELSRGLPDA